MKCHADKKVIDRIIPDIIKTEFQEIYSSDKI
jgi:hypothetical protein